MGEPLTDGAGNDYFGSIPKWRGVTSATLEAGKWSNTLVWNCVNGHAQTTRVDERVTPAGTLNFNAGWQVTDAATVSLILRNLSDKRPSWDSSTTFFDFTQAGPRGRTASVKVAYKFQVLKPVTGSNYLEIFPEKWRLPPV